MRIKKCAAVVALVVASSTAYASGSGSLSGVIRFTGEIVTGVCNMPAYDWYRHIGQQNGHSPSNTGAVPSSTRICAGIADTRAINFLPLASSGSRKSGTVVIDFN